MPSSDGRVATVAGQDHPLFIDDERIDKPELLDGCSDLSNLLLGMNARIIRVWINGSDGARFIFSVRQLLLPRGQQFICTTKSSRGEKDKSLIRASSYGLRRCFGCLNPEKISAVRTVCIDIFSGNGS
jgi:hypothetical protein